MGGVDDVTGKLDSTQNPGDFEDTSRDTAEMFEGTLAGTVCPHEVSRSTICNGSCKERK